VHEDNRRRLTSFPEAKMLEVKEDCILGKHYHKIKTERFLLSCGEATLTIQNKEPVNIEIGKIYTVNPGEMHTFNIKKGSILIGLNSKEFDPSDDYRV
jgi:mannose-6-phosphate isomerase-like protein (cupin superfamily)